MRFLSSITVVSSLVGAALPAALPDQKTPDDLERRQTSGTVVDLGYAIYQGVTNSTLNQTWWKGIRFAASTGGKNRWQAPQPPPVDRSKVIQLPNAFPPRCPQSPATPLVSNYNFTGSEDCLFLSVFAPTGAKNLPVLVYIHGGGYGGGSGATDFSQFIANNNNDLIVVGIQYRLGALGFLASDEVFRNGVVNAGLLDQHFALQWVQTYINLFGGNASQVTIAGESAGGGSVMLQAMAYGGSLGTTLFTNVIADSPYLPLQYSYKDWLPSQAYYAFAHLVGCLNDTAYGNVSATVFGCLQAADTVTLQKASAVISGSGNTGTWAFLPVTDGVFLVETPTQQLLKKRVNGLHMLSGNNVNEGEPFVRQNINTEDELVGWIQQEFPLLTNGDISKLLMYYPSTNASDNPDAPKFATLGDGPEGSSTAVNVSQLATGQQQRADVMYAETTFICPAYWLAEAFTDKGRAAYKYQYSVPVATHGADLSAVLGTPTPNQAPEFAKAFGTIWGNFIVRNNPSVPDEIANVTSGPNVLAQFPVFSPAQPSMVILNETGGVPYDTTRIANAGINVTQFMNPGLMNDFRVVNAYTFEGGRGTRCDFWRSIAAIVPE